jgi:hypothetical protein
MLSPCKVILLSNPVAGAAEHHGGKMSEFLSLRKQGSEAHAHQKVHVCYTVFALSDLAVSGSEPHQGKFA